jgi:hypothetical protein
MRMVKWLAGLVVVFMIGALPSCASMGGRAMRYLFDLRTPVADEA